MLVLLVPVQERSCQSLSASAGQEKQRPCQSLSASEGQEKQRPFAGAQALTTGFLTQLKYYSVSLNAPPLEVVRIK